MTATARAVDLSKVKEGGVFRQKRKPSGDYAAKIVKASDHQPNDKSKPVGWVLTVQVDGDARSTYPYYLSPAENQVWKIGQVCRAAGLNVKNTRVRFDPNKLVGKAVGIALEDDEYEGRLKSVIDEMFPVSEVGASASDDAPDGDEVYDDDEDPADEPEDDEPEEEEEPPPPPKRRRKAAPVPEPEPEDEEEDVEEDVEEEEEPPPPPRKRTATKRTAAPAKKATRPVARARTAEPEDDDDLDLDDLD